MAKSDLNPDVASLLECGICLEEYEDPRALPCLHSFCLRCLKQHISATKARDGSFHCPTCRDKFTPPEGDVEKFPRNFFLNSLKDAPMSTSKHLEGPVVPTQCEPHKNKPDWYCQTCNLPGCAECMLRYHKLHETVEVASIACKLEPDLLAVCTLAVKRLATLQNISSDFESRDTQMETDTAQACGEITKAADGMRTLITEYEKKLLNKVKEARETFKKQAANAKKECDVLKNATSNLNVFVERLQATKSPLRTVLHAPIAKQEMLQQQDVAVPSVEWKVNRTSVKPWEISAGNVVGGVEMETSLEQEKTIQTENAILQPSLQVTNLQLEGVNVVWGMTHIYGNMVCVVCGDEYLWVYTGDGDLRRKVSIPEIEGLSGVVAVDGTQGKLAVVGVTREVHFVTLSTDLEVQQHTMKDVPLVAYRISLSGQRQLIVSRTSREESLPCCQPRAMSLCRQYRPTTSRMGRYALHVHRPDQSRLCDL